MIKQLVSIAVPALVLVVLVSELNNNTFYTDNELDQHRRLSVELARDGNLPDALERLQALSEIAPDNQAIQADYITVLQWAHDNDKAVAQATALDFDHAPDYALEALALAAARANNTELLFSLSDRVLAASDRTESLVMEIFQALSDHRNYRAARTWLVQGLNHVTHSKPINRALAQLNYLENPEQAVAQLAEVLEQSPDDTESIELLSRIANQAARNQQHSLAVTAINLAVSHMPANHSLRVDQLVIHSWAGQHAQAIDQYQQLSASAPALPEHALAAIAQSALATQHTQLAVDLYQQLHTINPADKNYRLNLARALTDKGNASQAVNLLTALVEDYPDDYSLLPSLAYAYEQQPDPVQTVNTLNQYFTYQQPSPSLLATWVNNLEQAPTAHHFDTWSAPIKRQMNTAQLPIDLRIRLIKLLFRQANSTAADTALATLDPAMLPASELNELAKSARDNRLYPQAIALYQSGQQRYPGNMDFVLGLGLALSHSDANHTTMADVLFTRLQQKYPDHRAVLDAQLYHQMRHHPVEQQAATLQRLARLTPRNAPYLNRWLDIINTAHNDPQQRLRALLAVSMEFPTFARSHYEIIGLLSQNGDCRQALSHSQHINLQQAPAYTMEDLGFSARQCQDYPEAMRYYTLGAERFPRHPVFAAGTILTSTEQQDYDRANRLTHHHLTVFPNDPDVLHAAAYSAMQQQDFPQAIGYYDTILTSTPDDAMAIVQRTMATNFSGHPERALQQANAHPQLFSNDHWRRLYADDAAYAIRNSSAPGLTTEERDRLADQAINKLDSYLDFLATHLADDTHARAQALMDKTVALQNRRRHQQTLDTYAELQSLNRPLPDYVVKAVADAHLRLQQPEPAIALLTEQLQAEPESTAPTDLLSLLFFAHLDNEDYPAAQQTLARIEAQNHDHSVWPQRLVAQFDAYRNHLHRAQLKLETLHHQHPDDIDTHIALATIYRWRGWAEKSAKQLEQALQRQPDQLATRIAHTETLLALQDYRATRQQLDKLSAIDAEHSGVKRLQADWDSHNLRQWITEASYGKSDGNAISNKEFTLDSWLFDRPFQDHWRPFIHYRKALAEVPDNPDVIFLGLDSRAEIERAGLGIQYRGRQLNAQLELSRSLNAANEDGVSLSVDWHPGDHWTFSALHESYSLSVPLRGINDGVDGDTTALALQYRWHENARTRLSAKHTDISEGRLRIDGSRADDNDRKEYNLSHYQRVYRNEHHSFALIGNLFRSDNQGDADVLYYNPDQDTAVSLSGEYEGLLWRRYDKHWQHRLTLGLGNYNQRGFGSAFIWDAEYEQRWQFHKHLSARYGVLFRQRSYDGDSENFYAIFAGFNWRF